jgi:hypothetical protein
MRALEKMRCAEALQAVADAKSGSNSLVTSRRDNHLG